MNGKTTPRQKGRATLGMKLIPLLGTIALEAIGLTIYVRSASQRVEIVSFECRERRRALEMPLALTLAASRQMPPMDPLVSPAINTSRSVRVVGGAGIENPMNAGSPAYRFVDTLDYVPTADSTCTTFVLADSMPQSERIVLRQFDEGRVQQIDVHPVG